MQVALGGTFDPVHDGHRALFHRAFELGDVTVGLTSDALAPDTRPADRVVRPYPVRRAALATELTPLADDYGQGLTIRRLESPTGIATEPPFDAVVVSPETRPGGERINDIRTDRGLAPVTIEVVDHVLADDGDPISSTRIVRGEIDEHGHVTPERDGREPPEQPDP